MCIRARLQLEPAHHSDPSLSQVEVAYKDTVLVGNPCLNARRLDRTLYHLCQSSPPARHHPLRRIRVAIAGHASPAARPFQVAIHLQRCEQHTSTELAYGKVPNT